MEQEKASLLHLPGVDEVLDREFAEAIENMSDPSTNAEAKRQVIATFDITPFPDRKGATITFTCKSKLAGVEAVKTTVFLSKRTANGKTEAFIHDPAQERLFAIDSTPTKQ